MAMAAEQKVVRLHVGGLTPAITSEHLLQRFKIFGQVDEVETLAPDGLGQPRSFAYVTLRVTPAQLKRCLNTLSGSMYRGAQLRIAEARPRYADKIAKENSPTALQVEKDQLRARKRARLAMGPDVGRTAQNMEVITLDTYKRSKFWNETPSHHLIRPLALRPLHPLPPPISATAASASAAAQSTIGAKDKKGKDRKANKSGSAIKRQRLRVINPFMWAPTHLGEAVLNGGQEMVPLDAINKKEVWDYVPLDEDENEDEEGAGVDEETSDAVLMGHWISTTGEKQPVRVKRHLLPDPDGDGYGYEGAELDADEDLFQTGFLGEGGERDGTSSPLFGGRELREESADVVGGLGSRESSPLFPNGRERVASSPSFGARQATRSPSMPADASTEDAESVGEQDEVTEDGQIEVMSDRASSPLFGARDDAREASTDRSSPSRSASPLFPPHPTSDLPLSPRVDPTTISKSATAQSMPKADIPADLLKQVKTEQSRELSLINSLISSDSGQNIDADVRGAEAKPTIKGEWRGYAESDDDDDDFYAKLKIQQAEQKAEAAKDAVEIGDLGVKQVAGKGVMRLRGGGVSPGEKPPVKAEDGDEESDDESDDSDSSDSSGSSDTSSSGSSSDSSESDNESGSGSDSSSDSSSSSSSSSDSSSDSDSESDSSSDSDESESEDEAPNDGPDASAAAAPSGGFSLAAIAGDMEMDELDIPLNTTSLLTGTSSTTGPGLDTLEPLVAAPSRKQLFDPSPSIPLFFLPIGAAASAAARPGWALHPSQYQYPDTGASGMARGYGAPMNGGGRSLPFAGRAGQGQAQADASHYGQGANAAPLKKKRKAPEPFWRPSKQTDEHMRERWESVRRQLTGEWKVRAREARKQRRRRGGGDDD